MFFSNKNAYLYEKCRPPTTTKRLRPRPRPLIYDKHIWSSYMIIIYDHHMWWSYMIIIYGHHVWSSYMSIIGDHHIWSSYMMIVYDDHIWSYKMILYDEIIYRQWCPPRAVVPTIFWVFFRSTDLCKAFRYKITRLHADPRPKTLPRALPPLSVWFLVFGSWFYD